ncbi:hypothetical protein M0802_016886 [Mischocyttarus mexicanus]|nr:hypothetical protein M0802_016886 [Mischocyttarus mexicanus]
MKLSTQTDTTDVLQLAGISTERRNSLGTSVIRMYGEDILIYLVEENFPIQSDCILGNEFLGSRSAKIYYTLRCLNYRNILELLEFSVDTLPDSGSNINELLSDSHDPDQSSICHIYIRFLQRKVKGSDDDITTSVTDFLDNTAGRVNDLTNTPHKTNETMTTNEVSPDTGRTSNYEVLYSPHQACVRTQTQMLSENMGITRDPFNLRHDNLVVFTDLEGTPCDLGAKLLHELELLPKIDNLTLARARVMKFGKFNLIIISIKEHITNSLKYETLVEATGALLYITREL